MSNTDTQKVEYVYSPYQSVCSWIPDRWTEHPIVKKTARFFYVAWLGRSDHILRLDRQELGKSGRVFKRGGYGSFYTAAGKIKLEQYHLLQTAYEAALAYLENNEKAKMPQ